MKNRHYDLIEAKINNMDLAVLIYGTGGWGRVNFPRGGIVFYEDVEYFLCHENHVDVCLHWLNGGEGEHRCGNDWIGFGLDDLGGWHSQMIFMFEKNEIRIKPKKESRWIAVHTGRTESLGGRTVNPCSHAFVNEEDAQNSLLTDEGQVIEIEIEVKA